ncbi:hypothetical protein AB0C07_38880 [Actinoplanes missouriensis]
MHLDVEVPPGATAELHFPDGTRTTAGPGHHTASVGSS